MKCSRCKKEVEKLSILSCVCDECETPKDRKKVDNFMGEINKIANEVLNS